MYVQPVQDHNSGTSGGGVEDVTDLQKNKIYISLVKRFSYGRQGLRYGMRSKNVIVFITLTR